MEHRDDETHLLVTARLAGATPWGETQDTNSDPRPWPAPLCPLTRAVRPPYQVPDPDSGQRAPCLAAALDLLTDIDLLGWVNSSFSLLLPSEFNMGGWDSPLGLWGPRVLNQSFSEAKAEP